MRSHATISGDCAIAAMNQVATISVRPRRDQCEEPGRRRHVADPRIDGLRAKQRRVRPHAAMVSQQTQAHPVGKAIEQ